MIRGSAQRYIAIVLGAAAAVVLALAIVALVRSTATAPTAAEVADGPSLEAVVQAVTTEESLAVLSVGKEDGVEVGSRFAIHREGYRQGRPFGVVVIIKVYDGLCGARVLSLEEGQTIQIGDRASLRR